MYGRAVLAVAALALAAPIAHGQPSDWPTRPIKLVVPYPPGGSGDALARLAAPGLAAELGKPVVIENRPGSGGVIGVGQVVNAEPDGYTFGLGAVGHFAIQPYAMKVPYRLEDVNYVTMVAQSPHVFLVNPARYPDLKSVVEAARTAPGRLNYGSAGTGSTTHLDTELLAREAQIDIQHIPYKGGVAAATDLMAGLIQLQATEIAIALELQPRVKIAAVMAQQRIPQLPDVPTTAELGWPKAQASAIYGLIAPTRTPKEITERMRLALIKVLNTPEINARLVAQGLTVATSTAEEYRTLMESEHARWGALIKARNIKFD